MLSDTSEEWPWEALPSLRNGCGGVGVEEGNRRRGGRGNCS